MKEVWDDHVSLTVSGTMSSDEDLDYLLEAKNRSVKEYIPPGMIPSNALWLSLTRNNGTLDDIRSKLMQVFIVLKQHTTYIAN